MCFLNRHPRPLLPITQGLGLSRQSFFSPGEFTQVTKLHHPSPGILPNCIRVHLTSKTFLGLEFQELDLRYLWLIRDRQALVYIPFFRCVKISDKKHLWCVSKHCGGQFFASYWGRLWTGKGAVPNFNICLFKLCPINFSHVDFDKSIFPSIFFRWCSSSFMSIWKRQRSMIWIAALILRGCRWKISGQPLLN